MMLLNELPTEISHLIVRQLDNNALKCLRLANKAWNRVASEVLFDTITMTPTERGLNSWKEIIGNDILRHHPTKVIMNSCLVPDYEPWNHNGLSPEYKLVSEWGPNADEEEYTDFYTAIDDIARLPNLDHAVLHFTGLCTADDGLCFTTGVEDVDYRFDLLERFFRSLQKRVKKQKFGAIKSLTICNLQNMPTPDFTSSTAFKQVSKPVEHLHLHICEEFNEHGPDNDINCDERRTFMPYLASDWLTPFAARLRTLTLFFPDYWGPVPGYFDGSNLKLPVLQTLNLGRYCVAHDDALDWVYQQKGLRTLRMYACPIGTYFRLNNEDISEWDVRTHDWTKMPEGTFDVEGDDEAIFHYPGVWAKVFASIRTEMSRLEDFRFHFDERTHHYADEPSFFDRPDLLDVGISPQRYTAFDIGILPSQWIIPESSGEMAIGEGEGVNVHEPNAVEDEKALNTLLEETRARRQLSQSKSLQ